MRTGETQRCDGADLALRRAVRAADGRAELHERLREVAAVPGGVARAQRRGERGLVRGGVDGRRVVEHARAHAQHIAVHGGGRPLKADRGDRPGRVRADARQGQQALHRVGPDAAARRDLLRAGLRLARAVIVPQPLPELEQLRFRQRREREHVRRGREKARVVPAHGLDARLLQHDLREPHVVRFAVGAPGQRARVRLKPAEQRLHRLGKSVRVHGCTSRKKSAPIIAEIPRRAKPVFARRIAPVVRKKPAAVCTAAGFLCFLLSVFSYCRRCRCVPR